jgi:hypothetical protein
MNARTHTAQRVTPVSRMHHTHGALRHRKRGKDQCISKNAHARAHAAIASRKKLHATALTPPSAPCCRSRSLPAPP